MYLKSVVALLQSMNDHCASAGLQLWNSVPDDIKSTSSLSMFRRKPKTQLYLFQQTYIRALFCSLFVIVLAMVVLAVMFN